MKLKRVVSLSLATAMALGLCACGGSSETATTAAATAAPTTAAETTAAPTQAAPETAAPEAPAVDRSQELVIYTNSAGNTQAPWLLEAAEAAGFNLNIVNMDGAALADRIVAEKNNPLADVIFGLNAVEYERIKAEGLLIPYEPEWVDKVDMALGDAEGYYYPIIIQPLFLMYNKDAVTNPPTCWEDLVDPQYEDQYTMLKLTGGTAKMITASILSRYQDPAGEYGVSQEGWELIGKLYANCHYQQDGEDYVSNLVDGVVPMTEMWGAGLIKHQKQREMEFGYVVPEYGCPFVVEQLGIVTGTDREALALDFINWFGAAEQMKGWSDNAGAIPANKDAMAMIDNQDIPKLIEQIKIQEVDWGFVAANVNDWVEKIQLEYLE